MPNSRISSREFLLRFGSCVVIAATLALRLLWYPITTSDYTYFVRPWIETLRTHAGLTAFAQPFADYAPLYLYLLKLVGYIPINTLAAAKTLSFLFDILIAYFAVRSIKAIFRDKFSNSALFFIGTLFLSIPTMMINSSLWAQSDAVYAAPILASLYFILTNQPFLAAFAFGIGLSVKVQAIFFLPIIAGYLLRNKETWRYLLVPPGVYILSILPVLFGGGDFFYWLFIYFKQAGEYPYLSVSAPSVFAFLQALTLPAVVTTVAFWVGIILAAGVAVITLGTLYRSPTLTRSRIVFLSLASTLLLPYFLPRMHERYFYLADIFSLLYVFYNPQKWYLPILVIMASLLSYMPFLSSQVEFLSDITVDLRLPSILLGIAVYSIATSFPHDFFMESTSHYQKLGHENA